MIIRKEQNTEPSEVEVVIRYHKITEEVEKIEALLGTLEHTISCTEEERIQRRIVSSAIYYIESIDKRTFIYDKEKIYFSKQRLYQLLEELSGEGFVQVSKSCIVNMQYVRSIRSLTNSRIEAELTNGEKVMVNRRYVAEIKTYLEGRQKG